MWRVKEELINQETTKYQIIENGVAITFEQWINLTQKSQTFVEYYGTILRKSRFEAYFWEVKPVVKSKLNMPFEFVLVESRSLAKLSSDQASFRSYFNDDQVVSFANLGGDAQLIVPTPKSAIQIYAHLANFVREAPKLQQVAFWNRVGAEYEKLIGTRTTWLSTSGLGVYWLHVRIDSLPKYYQHAAYKHSE